MPLFSLHFFSECILKAVRISLKGDWLFFRVRRPPKQTLRQDWGSRQLLWKEVPRGRSEEWRQRCNGSHAKYTELLTTASLCDSLVTLCGHVPQPPPWRTWDGVIYPLIPSSCWLRVTTWFSVLWGNPSKGWLSNFCLQGKSSHRKLAMHSRHLRENTFVLPLWAVTWPLQAAQPWEGRPAGTAHHGFWGFFWPFATVTSNTILCVYHSGVVQLFI